MCRHSGGTAATRQDRRGRLPGSTAFLGMIVHASFQARSSIMPGIRVVYAEDRQMLGDICRIFSEEFGKFGEVSGLGLKASGRENGGGGNVLCRRTVQHSGNWHRAHGRIDAFGLQQRHMYRKSAGDTQCRNAGRMQRGSRALAVLHLRCRPAPLRQETMQCISAAKCDSRRAPTRNTGRRATARTYRPAP